MSKKFEISYEQVDKYEVETRSHFLILHFVKTDMQNNYLKIEIEAEENKTHILFYVSLALILVVTVGIICGIVVLLKRYCCKDAEVHSISPFQAEDWLQQADARYEQIMKESPEGFYDKTCNAYEQEKCMVCLLNFTEGQPTRMLKCKHVFHKDCIEEWVKSKINNIPKCPTCNTDLTEERPAGYVEVQGEIVHASATNNLIPGAISDNRNFEASPC